MAAAATIPPPPTATAQLPSSRSWVSSLPNLTSILTPINPFAPAADRTPDAPNEHNDATASSQPRRRPAASALAQTSDAPSPPSPSRSSGSIMFAEPDSQFTSPTASRDVSPDDNGRRRRSKKLNKPKTSFSICHPAPSSAARQKLHRRPRSLLQLHKLVPDSRPTPAFEVIPSASFSVRLTRAITKVFKAKHGLCPNDLVVLHAEKYYTEEQEEEQEARDVLALICKGRKEDGLVPGRAKICMATGAEWEAYPLPNGGYEFFSTDEHGLALTTRWVPKRCKDSAKDPKRFNFSTISPNSRRHPVIANLTKSSLCINDSYKMPDAAALTPSTTPQATPSQKATILEDALDDEDGSKQEVRYTDDRLRELITVTGIWVAFKEGWSPFFKYDDPKDSLSVGMQSANTSRRSVTSIASTPPGSPSQAPDKRNSVRSVSSSIFRRSSMLSKSNRNSAISIDSSEGEQAPPARSPSVQHRSRARAESNATVLVHRAASNRRKNNHQATWRPDLLSARPELIDETSREDISRRTPPPPLDTTPLTPIDSAAASTSADSTPLPSRSHSNARSLAPLSRSASPAPATALSQPATRAPKPRVPKPVQVEKEKEERESTTTTETCASSPVDNARKVNSGKADARKPTRWRRLLCGKL